MPTPFDFYLQWIADHVDPDPHGQCKEITTQMAAAFPELRRVRGHYVCPLEGSQTHWWMVTSDGTIVDPTKAQFASKGEGAYKPHEGPEPTATCLNCGALVYGDQPFCNADCTNEFASYIENEAEAEQG